MNFHPERIETLCEIRGGKRLPKNHELQETETNHPYIRARDIGNGKISFDKPIFLNENTHSLISRYIVHENDIVITIVGANIGDVGLITKEFDGANLTENAVKLTAFRKNCHYKYLLYYFLLPGKKREIEQIAAGSAQGKLGLYKIKDIQVPLPTKEIQLKVAGILSAYDDLIENNLKRIKLLEEKAMVSYKELMQELSYSKVKREVLIKDCLAYYIGGGWGEEEYKEGFTERGFVIRGTDIPDVRGGNISGVPLRYHKESNLLSRKLQIGDIVFEISNGQIRNIGRTVLISEKLINQFLVPVMCASFAKLIRVNNTVSSEFFYLYLNEGQENGLLYQYKSNSANGINNFAFETFMEEVKIALPSATELRSFTEQVKPVFTLIAALGEQNAKLREARDILLPRLMSGEITV